METDEALVKCECAVKRLVAELFGFDIDKLECTDCDESFGCAEEHT